MKITIITVGKIHDQTLKAAIADYEVRLRQYIGTVIWQIIPGSDLETEGRQIIKRSRGTVILLDETGVLLTTPQFAQKIEDNQNNSVKHLTFIIGGAYGVSDSVKLHADFMWSLSPLVFPHQLIRLLLTEQLYRAYDILAGGKYHHN